MTIMEIPNTNLISLSYFWAKAKRKSMHASDWDVNMLLFYTLNIHKKCFGMVYQVDDVSLSTL